MYHDIDLDILSDLTEDHFRSLGVSLGDSMRLLRAIRGNADAAQPAPRGNGAARVSPPAPIPELPAPPAAAGESERRPLTVMFCDLADSTALSARLDPEDLQDVIRAYQEICTECIREYEGFVAKYMGDGILVYYGYPKSLERNAERAVRSALDIVEAIEGLNRTLGREKDIEIAVRVGIATGIVMVGEVVGEGMAQERTVIGEAPNTAARLQGLAGRNGIVVGGLTRELCGDVFVYHDLGANPLKGIDGLVQSWGVTGLREDTAREPKRDEEGAAPSPLVGRDEEIGLLRRAWQSTQDEGRGQVVTLTGEAGIGKSALIDGLKAEVRAQGLPRLTMRCSPYHTNSALYPVIEHFKRLARWQPEDDAPARLDKLETMLGHYSQPLGEAVPLMASLLSLPVPEDRYPPLHMTPQQQKQQTQDMITGITMEVAEGRPFLQVWEDLHWADPSTLELIGLLIEQAPTASLLMVATARSDFVPPWPARSHITPITLNRLERPHAQALVVRIAGAKRLPEEVVDHIVTKTDGVPLYVEELTKTILASDILRDTGESYELTGPLSSLSIPDTLQESLMTRLDRLPQVRELAQIASVLGREFAYEVISGLSTTGDAALRNGLGQLVDAELLYQRGRPPRAKYIFKHALIRDAAYASLLRRARQQHHRQAAELLEARFPETVATHPQIIAHHYGEAGMADRTIDHLLRAGDLSVQLHARAEASSYYEQALAAARTLGNSPDAHRKLIDATLKLAAVSASGADFERDLENLPRAQTLAAALNDRPRLGQVLYWLGRVYYSRGELAQAAGHAEQSLAIADELGDEAMAAPSVNLLGRYYVVQGNVARGSEMLARNVEQMRKLGNIVEEATAAGFAGFAYAWTGDFAQGFAFADRGLALAQQLDNPFAEAAAFHYRGLARLQYGAWTDAIADFSAARAIAEASGDEFRTYLANGQEAEAQIATGNLERAREMADDAIAFAERIGTTFNLGIAKRNRAAALVALGACDMAAIACQEAIDVADESAELLAKSRASRLLVDIWCRLDTIADREAENAILDVIRIQQELGAEPELLRSCLTYSRLLRSLGRPGKAREYHDRATDGFRRMGMAWDIAQASADWARESTHLDRRGAAGHTGAQ